MRKLIILFLVLCFQQVSVAQNYRDNIAVIINSTCFNCDLDAALQETMRSAYYAFFTTQLEKNELFRVVNRDNTDESIIGLGKSFNEEDPGFAYWVDYTEKLRQQSKGIGANYLILLDVFKYTNKISLKGEIYFRFKIIQTESNAMVSFTIKREEEFKSEKQFRKSVKEMINSVSNDMMEKIDEVWNTTFGIISANGKNLTIQPYSVFPLNSFQRVNWFEWEQHDIGGQSYFEVRNLGDSKITSWDKESIFVTSKMDFSKHDLQKVWGNIKPNYRINNHASFPVSYVELPLEDAENGIVNYKINTSIYDALESLPKYNLVQISAKELVYAEKDIQKGEEYMDGSTVDQNSSRKSDYMIVVKDLGSTVGKYKINVDFLSSATGKVLKTETFETSPEKLSNEFGNWLYARIMPPIKFEVQDKNVIVYTNVRTTIREDFQYEIIEMREVKMGSKTESVRIPLVTMKLKEQLGQKIVFSIDEVLEDGFKKVVTNNTYYLGAVIKQ
jgi:hypothetical protein